MTNDISRLVERIESLERKVDDLEKNLANKQVNRASTSSESIALDQLDLTAWTQPYAIAVLEVSDTWIELHEQSARPQLQRLIRQVVDEEGPVTEHLIIDRVRRAWGLKRAGGRVQEAFDQAIRQLVARGLAERVEDALVAPNTPTDKVRVPTEDESTKRGAEDVPLVEMVEALAEITKRAPASMAEGDLTMACAKVFGWNRRGGAIQIRLEKALEIALNSGRLQPATLEKSALCAQKSSFGGVTNG